MPSLSSNAWIILRQHTADWSAFVQCWDTMYNYTSKSDAYKTLVIKRDASFVFTATDVRKLFEWKNNTEETLSAKKDKSVEVIVGKLSTIKELATQWNDETFTAEFGKISAVWQTFLMHIIQPDRFPIFDQHVYRAYTYLQAGQADELKGTTKQKLVFYEQYRLFFEAVRVNSGCDARQLDRALWAFGKFMKQYKTFS